MGNTSGSSVKYEAGCSLLVSDTPCFYFAQLFKVKWQIALTDQAKRTEGNFAVKFGVSLLLDTFVLTAVICSTTKGGIFGFG